MGTYNGGGDEREDFTDKYWTKYFKDLRKENKKYWPKGLIYLTDEERLIRDKKGVKDCTRWRKLAKEYEDSK